MCYFTPTQMPTRYPTGQPSGQPTGQPSQRPTGQPSGEPTDQPSSQPSSQPTIMPSAQPSSKPSGQPTSQPSVQPTSQPSGQPSKQPTGHPTAPTLVPSGQPSGQPSAQPSAMPSSQPSCSPSAQPSGKPTSQPSSQPSSLPTIIPTCQPTCKPTCQPTSQPSERPSGQPTSQPSGRPSGLPTSIPSGQPSCQPSVQPSGKPTGKPSGQPSSSPSQPSGQPTSNPSSVPTLLIQIEAKFSLKQELKSKSKEKLQALLLDSGSRSAKGRLAFRESVASTLMIPLNKVNVINIYEKEQTGMQRRRHLRALQDTLDVETTFVVEYTTNMRVPDTTIASLDSAYDNIVRTLQSVEFLSVLDVNINAVVNGIGNEPSSDANGIEVTLPHFSSFDDIKETIETLYANTPHPTMQPTEEPVQSTAYYFAFSAAGVIIVAGIILYMTKFKQKQAKAMQKVDVLERNTTPNLDTTLLVAAVPACAPALPTTQPSTAVMSIKSEETHEQNEKKAQTDSKDMSAFELMVQRMGLDNDDDETFDDLSLSDDGTVYDELSDSDQEKADKGVSVVRNATPPTSQVQMQPTAPVTVQRPLLVEVSEPPQSQVTIEKKTEPMSYNELLDYYFAADTSDDESNMTLDSLSSDSAEPSAGHNHVSIPPDIVKSDQLPSKADQDAAVLAKARSDAIEGTWGELSSSDNSKEGGGSSYEEYDSLSD